MRGKRAHPDVIKRSLNLEHGILDRIERVRPLVQNSCNEFLDLKCDLAISLRSKARSKGVMLYGWPGCNNLNDLEGASAGAGTEFTNAQLLPHHKQ